MEYEGNEHSSCFKLKDFVSVEQVLLLKSHLYLCVKHISIYPDIRNDRMLLGVIFWYKQTNTPDRDLRGKIGTSEKPKG